MIKNGTKGDSTLTGLKYEKDSDFRKLIKYIPNYTIKKQKEFAGTFVYFKDKLVARSLKKQEFNKFLGEKNIDPKKILTKGLVPDEVLLVKNTLFIIEVKYQQGYGSVDEKLQTCDFKRKQYLKLVKPLGLRVEYVYILNDWFKKPCYKDVLEYIYTENCSYHFNELSLDWLGLPTNEV